MHGAPEQLVPPFTLHPESFHVDPALQYCGPEPQNPHWDRHDVASEQRTPLQPRPFCPTVVVVADVCPTVVLEVNKVLVVVILMDPHFAEVHVDSALQCCALEPQNPHLDRQSVTSAQGRPLQVPPPLLVVLVVVVKEGATTVVLANMVDDVVVVAAAIVLATLVDAVEVVAVRVVVRESVAKHWLTMLKAWLRSLGRDKMH